MKMLLSSRDFQNEKARHAILNALPKPISQCRVLFIPNEKSTPERLDSGFYTCRMQKYGFSEENLLIFDPRIPEKFCSLTLDLVYVSGGNTFMTLDMLRRCRFDQELIRYIRSGVVYIGGSAGAHIVTADISHLSCYDEVPEGMTDFQGLNLFPGILLCHFTPDRQAHYDRLCTGQNLAVYALTDEDSLLVEDSAIVRI